MAPYPLHPLDDASDVEKDYHESSDDDFSPTVAPADDSPSDSEADDDDTAAPKPTPRKGKRKAASPADLDSGDEVTIDAARKRKVEKRKGGKKGQGEDAELLEDEGGEGGLVKTRAQRRDETTERRPLVRTENATVDVDALWAQMSAAPVKPVATVKPVNTTDHDVAMQGSDSAPAVPVEDDLVAIKKTYTFAGQQTTEQKQIPRASLANYIALGWKPADLAPAAAANPPRIKPNAQPTKSHPSAPKIRRPLRRPSRFDANPTGFVRALLPEHQLTWPRKPSSTTAAHLAHENAPPAAKAKPDKAQKLNVVDKSRLDWTGFVDKEGIAEELDTHGKTKEAYLGRMDFLAGVEARKEEEWKRLKVSAAAAAASGAAAKPA
ncbi:bucentaur or craniofacial development-domain-containing protein [Massariosphaeria phaeospora]|uniref:SWR1-complex protein 5 n=1 Tax=Massariosphaeria phaeospora TaxID=100035 RepID=A0A7C8ID53_9PLEO|nr:bucentaur or craniofacial development-domain-containing protein [Massariosphaeria phaeospora]